MTGYLSEWRRGVWPGHFNDPVSFYRAAWPHRSLARPSADPIGDMYAALSEWAGETLPPAGAKRWRQLGGKRSVEKYRRWRLGGLMQVPRPLTRDEELEVVDLVEKVAADRRRATKRKNRKDRA